MKLPKFLNCVGALDTLKFNLLVVTAQRFIVIEKVFFFECSMYMWHLPGLEKHSCTLAWVTSLFSYLVLLRLYENGTHGWNILFGDSGYGCTNHLNNTSERSQLIGRTTVSRIPGMHEKSDRKMFWRVEKEISYLALGIRLKLDRIESVIVATDILHNICCAQGEGTPPVSEETAIDRP